VVEAPVDVEQNWDRANPQHSHSGRPLPPPGRLRPVSHVANRVGEDGLVQGGGIQQPRDEKKPKDNNGQ
jgi:hypothetical protein